MKANYKTFMLQVLLTFFLLSLAAPALFPQNRPGITITADRTDIQQWEKVNFKAELNYNQPGASYGFLINNEPVTVGVNNNEINNYEFQKAGSFVVKVYVKSNRTLTANMPSLSDSVIINVKKVSLSVSPQEVFTDDKVTFKLGYQLPENYVKYRFHFGDNSQSEWLTESITTHTYKHNGNFRAYCEIGKFDGEAMYASIQSEIKPVRVKIKETFEVKLSVITYAAVDDIIAFTANPITNSPNQQFSYIFDFGDGTISRRQSSREVNHSYNKRGNYKASVALVARNGDVLAKSEAVVINVNDLVLPQGSTSFIVDPLQSVTGEKISFRFVVQSDNKNLRYRFYYGQNIEPSQWLSINQSEYIYERPGVYRVYGEVGRFDGETIYSIMENESRQINIKPKYSVQLLTETQTTVDKPITFKAAVETNDENPVFRYKFDFGDLTQTTLQPGNEIVHSYLKAGSYKARVGLYSRQGELLAESPVINLIVQNILIPSDSIVFEVQPEEIFPDENVFFKVQLYIQNENLRFRFFYGQNSEPGPWLDAPESFHQYDKPDVYDVYAEIGRFDGDSIYLISGSATKRVVVKNPDFRIQLTADTSAISDGTVILIADVFTNTGERDFQYLFDFGDGQQTDLQQENTATHNYQSNNNYTATVRLLNSQGEVLAAASLLVKVPPPSNILIFILIALGVLAGGALAAKFLIKPKLKLKPTTDPGKQSISKEREGLIDITVRINPNFNQSEFSQNIDKEKLIEKVERST
jgi:PKD repeat protein